MLVFKQLIVYLFSDHAIYENSELEKTDPLNEIKVEKADEKESINKEEKSSQQILSQSQVCRLNEFSLTRIFQWLEICMLIYDILAHLHSHYSINIKKNQQVKKTWKRPLHVVPIV